jgi:bacterioferritin-associated ferredoxin
MYVCLCKGVTDRQIRKSVLTHDVSSLRDLRRCLGACDQCGKCAPEAKRLIDETIRERSELEQLGNLAS